MKEKIMNRPQGKHMDIAIRPSDRRSNSGVRPSRRQVMWLAVFLLLVVFGMTGLHWFNHRNDLRIDSTKYQVVFLDNNQVFFGQLQSSKGNYLTLKNAYYVQGDAQTVTAEQKPAGQVESTKLLKVSDTVYGPGDSMSIQSSKVLFWQNLEDDSKVTQAIGKRS
jgi:hypothetical protein